MLIYNDTIPRVEKQKLENEDIKNKIELLVDNTLSLIKKQGEIKREVDNILDYLSTLCFTKDTMIVTPSLSFFTDNKENYGIIRGKDLELSFCASDKEAVNLNQFHSPDIPLYLLSNELDQITGEIQKLIVKFMNFLSVLKKVEN